jgi:myosin heavy subunit
MLGAKYDFNRDRERRAGIDDMVFMSKNTDSEISHNLKIRFDVNYIYVMEFPILKTFSFLLLS